MRRCIVFVLMSGVLVACGPNDGSNSDLGPVADTGQFDINTPLDTGHLDTSVDPGNHDPGPADVPWDDGLADTADGGRDALDDGGDALDDGGDATGCPTNCQKDCPFGCRVAEDGSPACVCRDCAQDDDCAGSDLGTCPALRCSAGGTCVCDCSLVDPAIYNCPGGAIVSRCGCTAIGLLCLDHPEYQCPTVCTPGSTVPFSCPTGESVPWCVCEAPTCVPECRESSGEDPSGWFDPCTDELLIKADCTGCSLLCQHIGTRSEAWHDVCSGERITWAQCGPRLECDDEPISACYVPRCASGWAAQASCPGGGTVPLCTCDVPEEPCTPECRPAAGDDPEGWYDCKDALLSKDDCVGCTAVCDKVGSKSEGWYSSCGGLIAWDQCAIGKWQCADQPPLELCEAPVACLGIGPDETAPLLGPPWPQCCPGLARLLPATWNESMQRCESPDGPGELETAWFRCSLCGDGECLPPENRCNCPADCLPPMI